MRRMFSQFIVCVGISLSLIDLALAAERVDLFDNKQLDGAQWSDTLESVTDSTAVRAILSGSIGLALPSSQPPQGFSGAALSFAIRTGSMLAIGCDFSAGGTSFDGNSRTIYNAMISVGPSLKLVFREALIVSLLPAYQRVSSSTSSQLQEDVHLGANNFLTVGAGLGVRLGGVLVDFRLFPSFYSKQVSSGESVSGGHILLTFGYSGDVSLFR